MTTRGKFRTDADLWPGDPAFSEAIYRSDRPIGPLMGLDFSAQVIGSPRKTGKTTQINLMALKQTRASRYAEQSKIFVRIEEADGGVSQQELRDRLINDLRAPRASTFQDIILNSSVIAEYSTRKVLALINVENLQEDALRWLLRGIKVLENGDTARTLRLQVLIDGSFMVDTLTWGPDSAFPLTHLFPPEFTRPHQKQFVMNRIRDLKVRFTPSAYQALWHATAGDKYFTQAICQRMLSAITNTSESVVDADFLSDLVDKYAMEHPKQDDLKPDLVRCFFLLAEDAQHKESYVSKLLENVSDQWQSIKVDERAHAYKGGIIRRTHDGVELRAPLVRRIFEKTARRVRQVRALLGSRFTPAGVAERHRARAEQIGREIIELIYEDSLRSLHVGYGTKKTDGSIYLENAAALYEGSYSGTWEIATDPALKKGEEVWGLLWTWEEVPGERYSKMCVLPARH